MPRGRPQKPGKRTKAGRRIALTPFDHGAEHVQKRRDRYRRFHGGKAGQQVFDAIGEAWAVGLLENDRIDPAVLRDAGREYAARYWGVHASTAVKQGGYEGRTARGYADDHDPMGERFGVLDRSLRNAGRTAYEATQTLCIDPHWFPDEKPAWLTRLINERLVRAGESVCGQIPCVSDYHTMANALAGLLALAEGSAPMMRVVGGRG